MPRHGPKGDPHGRRASKERARTSNLPKNRGRAEAKALARRRNFERGRRITVTDPADLKFAARFLPERQINFEPPKPSPRLEVGNIQGTPAEFTTPQAETEGFFDFLKAEDTSSPDDIGQAVRTGMLAQIPFIAGSKAVENIPALRDWYFGLGKTPAAVRGAVGALSPTMAPTGPFLQAAGDIRRSGILGSSVLKQIGSQVPTQAVGSAAGSVADPAGGVSGSALSGQIRQLIEQFLPGNRAAQLGRAATRSTAAAAPKGGTNVAAGLLDLPGIREFLMSNFFRTIEQSGGLPPGFFDPNGGGPPTS